MEFPTTTAGEGGEIVADSSEWMSNKTAAVTAVDCTMELSLTLAQKYMGELGAGREKVTVGPVKNDWGLGSVVTTGSKSPQPNSEPL
jgi:hypothetical protein